MEPLLFYSTNRQVPAVNLKDALLQGQAGDRGLFLPERIPRLSAAEIAAFAGQPYAEVAHAVLRRYTAGVLDDERNLALCRDAYDYPVPLEPAGGRAHILRLDRGPTASFKDFAARMMGRWIGALQEPTGPDLIILTATSGDTGSAVAHAYHGVPRVQVLVLFPRDEVSTRQRKQMTTLGGNVATYAVDGKFDDCQAMVKRAFSDPELSRLRLSSANSINIGRLLPQSVYYLWAYAQLAHGGEPVIVSIPSGNFGDMMGAVLATRMGLPVRRLVIATNGNDEVPRFVQSGVYEKIVPSRVCLSNAMNVGHPSNLARLVDLYGGHMDETGALRRPCDMARLREDLYAIAISDDQTRQTIRTAHAEQKLLLEPHGAVAWAGLTRYLERYPVDSKLLQISVETAHPAKFPEEIRALLGVEPEVPPSLQGIEERVESYGQMTTAYEPFAALLRKKYA